MSLRYSVVFFLLLSEEYAHPLLIDPSGASKIVPRLHCAVKSPRLPTMHAIFEAPDHGSITSRRLDSRFDSGIWFQIGIWKRTLLCHISVLFPIYMYIEEIFLDLAGRY